MKRRVVRYSEDGYPYIKLYDGSRIEMDSLKRLWYISNKGASLLVHYSNGEVGFDYKVGEKKYKVVKRLLNNGLYEYLLEHLKL